MRENADMMFRAVLSRSISSRQFIEPHRAQQIGGAITGFRVIHFHASVIGVGSGDAGGGGGGISQTWQYPEFWLLNALGIYFLQPMQ
jgi:hypothetical protein